MAKELPYFKFEPNEWENGNIQILSREQKGLFIDLCSMYWSRLGIVPFRLAIQKLCDGNALALESLCNDGIITVENGFICIDFLNEQLLDFKNISKRNSKTAKEAWERRREGLTSMRTQSERNASASISQYESDAIREDKIREEEKREEKKREDIVLFEKEPKNTKFNFRKSLIDFGLEEGLVDDWLSVRKLKKATNTKTAFSALESEFLKCENELQVDRNTALKHAVESSWAGFKTIWIKNEQEKNKLQNGKQSNERISTEERIKSISNGKYDHLL